jgi:hypothetical protein
MTGMMWIMCGRSARMKGGSEENGDQMQIVWTPLDQLWIRCHLIVTNRDR